MRGTSGHKLPPKRLTLPAGVALGFALSLAGLAGAQPTTPRQFLDAVNEPWSRVAEADRAERILLPAIASMDPLPQILREDSAASVMLTPGEPAWASVESWALADAQRAALDALKQVTERNSRFVFALGYGEAAAPAEIVDANLHIIVGDPPLLAAMTPLYLKGVGSLADLVSVEAQRLAHAEQTAQAADLAIRLMRLGRMLAAREFAIEKRVGLLLMRGAVETALDLLYTHPGSVSSEQARTLIEQLDPDEIRLDRILPPRADRLALRQLVLESFIERGGPDPERFPALAALATAEDPLLAISRADWWARAAERHAGYFETLDQIESVFNDWELRWSLDPRDPILYSLSEYRRLDPARFLLIVAAARDQERLMEHRLRLRMTLQGARLAMGVVGYRAERSEWPRLLVAIRPRYVQQLPLDPFAIEEDAQPFSYFVPIRDQVRGPRELPRPHTVRVVGSFEQHALGEPARLQQWRDALRRHNISDSPESVQASLPRVGALLQTLAGLGMDPNNAEQVLGTDLSEHLPRLARLLGLRDSELDLVIPMLRALFLESEEFRSLYESVVRSGRRRRVDRLGAEQARLVLLEIGSAAERLRMAHLAEGAESFTVDLDESTFILYAVGPDLEAGWASSVGPLGEDALVWPPMISLYRQHHRSQSGSPQ